MLPANMSRASVSVPVRNQRPDNPRLTPRNHVASATSPRNSPISLPSTTLQRTKSVASAACAAASCVAFQAWVGANSKLAQSARPRLIALPATTPAS